MKNIRNLLFVAIALLPLWTGCDRKQDPIDRAKATVERLMPHFDFDYKTESYNHKDIQRDGVASSISMMVFNGRLSAMAHYVGERGISLERVMIKIGDEVKSFGSVELTSVPILRNDTVIEGMLISGDETLKLGEYLASNAEKKVRVSYVGRTNYDFTLDKKNHKRICETVELYNALQTLKAAGIDPQTL